MQIEENVTPEGLRARAAMVRDALDDGGSCARHLELAAKALERERQNSLHNARLSSRRLSEIERLLAKLAEVSR